MLSNYNDINFILELDADTFIKLIDETIEIESVKREDKIDEFLLHRWGYELNYMEKPIGFEEYRKIALGGNKKTTESKNQKSNEQLIEEIERIKKIDQEFNGGERRSL